jgi:hypothetical protein
MIKLRSISLYSYNNTTEPSGTITFAGDVGEVQLKLTPETCAKIVEICADQIVTALKQVASQMSVEALGVPTLIEHKKEIEIDNDVPF